MEKGRIARNNIREWTKREKTKKLTRTKKPEGNEEQCNTIRKQNRV